MTYRAYKAATAKVFSWLGVTDASSLGLIWTAVSKVHRDETVVPASVYFSLADAIELRQEYHARFLEKDPESNQSHIYFIDFLKRIKRVFRPLVAWTARPPTEGTATSSTDTVLHNRFQSLEVDFDANVTMKDMEEWSSDLVAHQELRPQARLVTDDERWQATDVVFAMCVLMDRVVGAWSDCRRIVETAPQEALLAPTRAAAVTNALIDKVQRQWFELTVDIPAITTVQDLLVVALIPSTVDALMLKYRGDITFENTVAALSVITSANERELTDGTTVLQVSRLLKLPQPQTLAVIDLGLRVRVRFSTLAFAWSVNTETGGDRSMGFTMGHLQGFTDALPANSRTAPVAKEGFFGERWDEITNPARTLSDLTDWFMAEVMPVLTVASRSTMAMERRGPDNQPFNILFPLSTMLPDYINKKKLTAPFLFAVHAMLLAQLTMEGFVDSLGIHGKAAMRLWREQTTRVCATNNCDPPLIAKLLTNLDGEVGFYLKRGEGMKEMRMTKHGETGSLNWQRASDRAFWNPLWLGQNLLYLNCVLSQQKGLIALDSSCQARLVLHLYNALRVIGAIEHPLPLLEALTHALSRSGPSLCPGGTLPQEPGRFLLTFLLAYGFKSEAAACFSETLRAASSQDPQTSYRNLAGAGDSRRDSARFQGRDLVPFEEEKVSLAFRRCVARDLGEDTSDKVEVITEALSEPLFGVNLVLVGRLLQDFVFRTLVDLLELGETVEHSVALFATPQGASGGRRKSKKAAKPSRHGGFRESEINHRRTSTIFHLFPLFALCDNAPTNGLADSVRLAAGALVEAFGGPVEQGEYCFMRRVGPVAATRCATCNAAGCSLNKCSACLAVSYCSKECQLADWKQHKATCKRLRESRSASSS